MERRPLTHDEAVREVYRLTPQIREYDEFMYMGVRWLPYTMFFHHQNYRSDVINTDGFGFRRTVYKGQTLGVSDISRSEPVSLILGGSTTLGTGATTDAHTVASRLSARTSRPWLNFGARGYNAVQEVLLYMMHAHRLPPLRDVVVWSGLNTLTLEGLPDELATEHGRFYYSFEFQHYMDQYNADLKRRSRTYASELDNRKRGFVAKYSNWFRQGENPADAIITDGATDLQSRIVRAATVVTNSLTQLKLLLAGTGARLSFVLQPMAYWVRDYLAPEEIAVFEAIDACPNNFWRLFSKILAKEVHAPFADVIRKFCLANDIRFSDMNETLRESPISDKYLFVDRVHFNDEGYDEAARLIAASVL